MLENNKFKNSNKRRKLKNPVIKWVVRIVGGFFILIFSLLYIGIAITGTTADPRLDNITLSTIKRERLPRSPVTQTEFISVHMGEDYYYNHADMTLGLKEFYKLTGVIPYVYITDSINGTFNPTNMEIKQFTESLFSSEGMSEDYLVLLYMEKDYALKTFCYAGTGAAQVMDAEAIEILRDFLFEYYYSYDYNRIDDIGSAFNDAAVLMMAGRTPSPWLRLFLLPSLAGLVWFCYKHYKNYIEQKMLLEKAQLEILSKPLQSFGDDTEDNIEQLENKYKE